ncbi:DgyrCDS8328 [Dimorphilus gyrociliatus]|uniref:DgyrCDS8328 n=1 Tax=Dimorphilus gyrociliatus TaxID=2664684 RepID=A0A7I8VVI3_9ANNE|nr:DgyrCDS8328 [Dimorphilus gyrociliatus]
MTSKPEDKYIPAKESLQVHSEINENDPNKEFDNDQMTDKDNPIDCRKKDFQTKFDIDELKKIIPKDHLLIFILKDQNLLDIVENDANLQTSLLENQYIKDLIDEDVNTRKVIDKNPKEIVNLLKDSNFRDKLNNKYGNLLKFDILKSNLTYSRDELIKFNDNIKRSMAVLSAEAATFQRETKQDLLDNPSKNSLESYKFIPDLSQTNNLKGYEQQIDKLMGDLKLITNKYQCEKSKADHFKRLLYDKKQDLDKHLINSLQENKNNSFEALLEAEIKNKQLQVENETLYNELEGTRQDLVKSTIKTTELDRELQKCYFEKVKLMAIVKKLNETLSETEEQMIKVKNENRRLANELNKESAMLKEYQSKLINKDTELNNKITKIHTEYEEAVEILKNDNRILQTKVLIIEEKVNEKTIEASRFSSKMETVKLNLKDISTKLHTMKEEDLMSKEDIEQILNGFESKNKENFDLKCDLENIKSILNECETDKSALERNNERLADMIQRMQVDIKENSRRLGDARKSCLEFEKLYNDSQDKNSSLLAELRQSNSQWQAAEKEKEMLSENLKKANEGRSSLEAIVYKLRNELERSQLEIGEHKTLINQLNNQVSFLQSIQENLNKDLSKYHQMLNNEKDHHLSLREQYKLDEKQQGQLFDKIKLYEVQMSKLEQQLKEAFFNVEALKADKEKLEEKLKNSEKKLGNSEELLGAEQLKFEHTLESIRNDFINDLTYSQKEKKAVSEKLNKVRNEMEQLREQLHFKNSQLQSHKHSLEQLKLEVKGRRELEFQLLQSENELKDCRNEINLFKEQANETNIKLNENIEMNTKLSINVKQLKEQLEVNKREDERNLIKLRKSLEETMKLSKDEIEDLKEQLFKTKADLQTCQASKLALEESKEAVSTSNYHFERTIESLKHRLHQEIRARLLACKHIETLKHQKELDYQDKVCKSSSEEQIKQLEKSLEEEKNNVKSLKRKIHLLRSSAYTQEAHVQSLEVQLMEYYNEASNLKYKINAQENISSKKDCEMLEDLRSKLRLYDKERSIFLQSTKQLTTDLDIYKLKMKETVKENTKLKSKVAVFACKLQEMERECNFFKNFTR